MTAATDWDRYYQNTPKYTSVTRSLSSRKIIGLMKEHAQEATTLCEFGGANSCFVEAVCEALSIARYHVIDLNAYGLSLLQSKTVGCELSSELADVLASSVGPKFDVVYSVGLIEHFQPKDTATALKSHFDRCKPGGVVLVTFPTPTLPYRIIRGAAEVAGRWNFPDERPLLFGEVIAECQRHGEVIHTSVNWWIGLTQGYVLTRKQSL